MEDSHFIHRVHNADNYVLDPGYSGEEQDTIEQIKQILIEQLAVNNVTLRNIVLLDMEPSVELDNHPLTLMGVLCHYADDEEEFSYIVPIISEDNFSSISMAFQVDPNDSFRPTGITNWPGVISSVCTGRQSIDQYPYVNDNTLPSEIFNRIYDLSANLTNVDMDLYVIKGGK